MIRVGVISDIGLYREGVAAFLRQVDDFDVVAVGQTAGDALRLVTEQAPDVVLVDVALEGSLDVIRWLSGPDSAVRTVALTIPEVEQAVLPCIEAGIAGYVTRDGGLDDLVAVIRSAARGEGICSARMVGRLWARLAQLARATPADSPIAALTVREREILTFIEGGRSNKEIAAGLSIELATVKNHVHNILQKLNVRRRGEAVAALRRRGTVERRTGGGLRKGGLDRRMHPR